MCSSCSSIMCFLIHHLSSNKLHHFPLDKLIINRFTGSMDNSSEIMWSNLAQYQDNLESSFSAFLQSRGSSKATRKNYTSDLRYFFSWITLTIQSTNALLPQTPEEFIATMNPHTLEQYKHFLVANRIPAATINRRLSALRSFGALCLSHKWWQEDPTVILTNVAPARVQRDATQEMLTAFRADLAREGASKVTIKNYTSDVRQFLHWLEGQEG